eukprot:s3851_g9.t1
MRVLSPAAAAALGSAEEELEDAYDCSVAIRQLGKTSQWVRSLAILQGMQPQRLCPNDVVYNSAITACGAQRWHLALDILQTGQHMQIFGCRNLRIARNSAMSACTRAARWRETLTSLKDLQTAGLRPDSWSYVAVLGTVPAGSGCWPLVLRHLEVMQLYTPLELMTLTAAISACGEWQKALALFQTMIDLSIRATLVTATAVIAACARSHWQKALSSYVGLPQRSLTANEVTRASAIRACDEGQQWQAALQIFRVKVDNVVLLNEAISCGQSSGNWGQALDLLCGWRRRGVHESHAANVDEITLGAASSNCEARIKADMYRVQSQWANCCTQTAYVTSLATWADAAKDYYFNSSTEEAARGDEAADHPFQLGAAPWVIRSHSFVFHEQRRYHSCTDYRSHLAYSTAVTRLGKTSLDLEHNIYHERSGDSPKLLCQVASSIIVFSNDSGRPAAHGMEVHASSCSKSAVHFSKDLGREPDHSPFRHMCKPRFSDIDGHGHVNNANLIGYLQDARHAAKAPERLEDIFSLYIEFLSMANLDSTLEISVWSVSSPAAVFFHMRDQDGRSIVRARMDTALPEVSIEKTLSAKPRLKPSSASSSNLQAGTSGSLESSLRAVVQKRRDKGLLRQLSKRSGGQVDFCSNDYLGFAMSTELAREVEQELLTLKEKHGEAFPLVGSTGSRLLSGNSAYCEALEEELANFHGAEAALIFNSGFDLNLGFFASVPQPGDVVLYDELIHQSMREGLKLSRGKSIQFRHNDVAALREAVAGVLEGTQPHGTRPNIIIAVESVYSMDGHCAPLQDFCDVAESVGASIVVDEAHGTGVYGREGQGLVSELGLESRIFCRVHTFGKALGVHGAAVVGPRVLREYLLNYAWPLVYSTSLPLHSLAAIRCAYAFMRREASKRQVHLRRLIQIFQERLADLPPERVLQSDSPIQGLIVPGNAACLAVARRLRDRFDVLPIRSPTVPAGTERLRIILHAHNTEDQVHALMNALEECLRPDSTVPEPAPAARL